MIVLNVDLDVPDFPTAACIGADPDLFYPEEAKPARAAKALCSGCPVREACLQWALDRNDHNGVWGGLTGKERKARQRELGARACRTCHISIPSGAQLCDPCREDAYAARHVRYRRSVAA